MTEPAPIRPRARLYLITPPRIDDLEAFAATFETCLEAGDVACLQIRLKQADGAIDVAATRAAANMLIPIANAREVAVIINDDPALAVEVGADGAHVGASDMGVKAARSILSDDMILGATAKDSRHTAMLAGEAGADYVAFGAFYPSPTKSDTATATPDVLAVWQESMELPCVAIGGITIETAAEMARSGADFVAVSSAVWAHSDGAPVAVAALNAALDGVDYNPA